MIRGLIEKNLNVVHCQAEGPIKVGAVTRYVRVSLARKTLDL